MEPVKVLLGVCVLQTLKLRLPISMCICVKASVCEKELC